MVRLRALLAALCSQVLPAHGYLATLCGGDACMTNAQAWDDALLPMRSMNYTGNVAADLLWSLLPPHQNQINLCNTLSNMSGPAPALLSFCNSTVSNLTAEVAGMQSWLSKNGLGANNSCVPTAVAIYVNGSVGNPGGAVSSPPMSTPGMPIPSSNPTPQPMGIATPGTVSTMIAPKPITGAPATGGGSGSSSGSPAMPVVVETGAGTLPSGIMPLVSGTVGYPQATAPPGCGNTTCPSSVQLQAAVQQLSQALVQNISCSAGVDFARLMLAHQAVGVAMCATLAATPSNDAFIVGLCANITASKTAAAAWLANWLQSMQANTSSACAPLTVMPLLAMIMAGGPEAGGGAAVIGKPQVSTSGAKSHVSMGLLVSAFSWAAA